MKQRVQPSSGLHLPRRAAIAAMLLLVCVTGSWRAVGAEVPREYQLKAVLLFRLTQFVDWPADAFAKDDSPVVIGILGDNPFGAAVEIAAKGETAHRRPIEVRYLRDANEAAKCHVLYIARSERARLRDIIARLDHKSVLTVSDIESFATEPGEAVRFTTEENKIALRINLEATKAAGLSVDARLLRMAQVINK